MKVATSKKSVSAKGIVSLAPLFTLAILLLYPWAFSKSEVDAELLFERHEDVRIQIEQIPETLGHWIKYEDIEIPTGALKILNPNAHMSRIYQRIGAGDSIFATVMVIHCSDVRDMSRHYPPVCYPRSGWTPVDDGTTDWTIEAALGREIMGRTYTFTRFGRNGVDRVITVADTFVLPGGVTTRDMSDLLHVASRYRNSIEGVAQIQIYFEGDYRNQPSKVIMIKMLQELIESLPPSLFEVLDGDLNSAALNMNGDMSHD